MEDAKPVRTVYISGPMRGRPDYNYPQFHEVAKALRRNGLGSGEFLPSFNVLNPAENFDGDQDRPIHEYLALDIRQVLDADAVVLLPGWRNSEGARLEIAVAQATGKRFFLARPTGIVGGWEFSAYTPEPQAYQGIEVKAEPESIEEEASRLVRNGPRQKTYGHPRGDFDRVAGMWAALLGIPLTAEDVAIMMVAFKLARARQTPQHRDTKVDIIGYTICLDRLDEPQELPEWERDLIQRKARDDTGINEYDLTLPHTEWTPEMVKEFEARMGAFGKAPGHG